jgi:hypothetical protein
MMKQRSDDATANAIILEDSAALAIAALAEFADNEARLQTCGLIGTPEVCVNLRQLRKTLAQRQPQSVRLMLLDYSVNGGVTTDVLPDLIDVTTGAVTHPSLHPTCLILGWSSHSNVAPRFCAGKASGFISKHRPLDKLVDDVCFVRQKRNEGEPWVELT